MATEYGVTSEGFVIKPLNIIQQEIGEDLKSSRGEQINLQPESIFGSLRDVAAERLHELWELAQNVYNSQYPQTAEDVSFENILDFAALELLSARESTIDTQAFFGTATTVIPAGTQVSVDGDSTIIFETNIEVTLIAGTDEVQNIEFSATPTSGTFTLKYNTEETAVLNYNVSNTDVQTALNNLASLSGVTVSGSIAADFVVTFTSNDGKQPQPTLTIGTNTLSPSTTITITKTIIGVYQGTCSMTCTETGPSNANVKTVTVIENAISGLTRTFNVDDANLGRDQETIPEARIRRNTRLVTSHAGPPEAIKNHVLQLNNDEYADLKQLEYVCVYENTKDVIDSRNIPGHGVMVCVRQENDSDERDNEIAQQIFESKCAGIETSFGNDMQDITFSVTPTSGTWTLKYSGQETASLAYNISAATLQTELNNLSSLSGVIVTGDVASGFVVEFAGNNAGKPCLLLEVGTNSLSPSTVITIERQFNKVTKQIQDSCSINHDIQFTRPNEVAISLILDNFTTTSDYPINGDNEVKAYIVAWGNTLGVGIDIIVYPQLIAQIANVIGITDFDIKIGKKSDGTPTTDNNVIISDGTSTHPEFSSWSTTDITINHV